MENLVAVDWVVDVANEEGVGVGVEGGVEVASGVFFGEAEDELVDHVERDVLRGGGGVFELDLVVLLHAVESDEEADSDTEVVVFGVEGGPASRMASGCREEAAVVDEEHFGGWVADHVVGPSGQFELLSVVGKGEAGHGGGDDEAEGGTLAVFAAGIGDDVDPGHGGVGVGDDVVAPIVVKAAVLVIEFEVAPDTEFALGFEQGVLDFVLVVLVGDLESTQLFGDGDALLGGEGEAGHGVEEHTFGLGDIRAVEDEDGAGRADAAAVLSVASSLKEQEAMKREFDAAAREMLDGIPDRGRDGKRALEIYERLIQGADYTEEALYDPSMKSEHTAYGAIVSRGAVCDGFALAYIEWQSD